MLPLAAPLPHSCVYLQHKCLGLQTCDCRQMVAGNSPQRPAAEAEPFCYGYRLPCGMEARSTAFSRAWVAHPEESKIHFLQRIVSTSLPRISGTGAPAHSPGIRPPTSHQRVSANRAGVRGPQCNEPPIAIRRCITSLCKTSDWPKKNCCSQSNFR
jgi:hypothetical protein